MTHHYKLAKWLGLIALLVGATMVSSPAEASHFRFGILTWELAGPPGQVEFHLAAAFRRDGYSGSHADGRPQIGDIITENVGATGLDFGDGNSTGTLQFLVTAFSQSDNWIIGVALDPGTTDEGVLHTYANTATTYNAQVNSCCRIFNLNNRSSGGYVLESVVSFDGNKPPNSTLVPIVLVDENSAATFNVPGSDDDDDELRWRISTDAEAGGGASPPNFTIDPNTGQVTWNTVGLDQTNFWTAQIILEDLDSQGNPKSKTPIDFLMMIVPEVGNAPSCTISPAGPFTVAVGSPLTFDVTGSDPDVGATLEMNTGGLPAGATMTPSLPISGASPQSSTFDWTPAPGDEGIHNVIYTITDDTQRQAQCSAQITVEVPGTDTTPPVCRLESVNAGPPTNVDVFIHDPESGVASIEILQNKNATVELPKGSGNFYNQGDVVAFAPPETSSFLMNGVKVDDAKGSSIAILVTDDAGNETTCDPVVATVSAEVPEAYELGTNYPNPFNPSTVIPFRITESGSVRLSVYDLLGREVIRLVDGSLNAGSYEVTWDGMTGSGEILPSGVYLYRLETGEFSETKQMLLTK